MRYLFLLLSSAFLFSCEPNKDDKEKFGEINKGEAQEMINLYHDGITSGTNSPTLRVSFSIKDLKEIFDKHGDVDSIAVCPALYDDAAAKRYEERFKTPAADVLNKATLLIAVKPAGSDDIVYYEEASICPPPQGGCNRYGDLTKPENR
jgi:hypothetical protein